MTQGPETAHWTRMMSIMKRLRIAALLLSLCMFLFVIHANAQSDVTFQSAQLSNTGASMRARAHYAGGTVTSVDVETYGDGSKNTETYSASLSDLDLGTLRFGMNPYGYGLMADVQCKADRGDCVSQTENGGVVGSPVNSDIGFFCPSQSECQAFIDALKQAQSPGPAPIASGPTQASPTGPVAIPQQPVKTPEAAASTPSATLHDLLASIGWLSGPSGTNSGNSALDQLLHNIKLTWTPPKRPIQLHFTYAAFAQAGGFDANGALGVGTGTDLNSAIGAAENTCHQGAQSVCDDEGYCLLRPGLWGAWASDLKVAGNSAFTCNVATEDEARAQAQAWCGDVCKVLWSGAGQ